MKKIFLAVVVAASYYTATGQAGQLDPSFGNQGIVRTDFGSNEIVYNNKCQKILLLPNGSFYLVFTMNSQTLIVRRLANGALDESYGDHGYSVPVFMYWATAVLQPDGKIVVGGTTRINNNEDFAVARFNTNGSLDNSFSGDGKVVTDFSPTDNLHGLALQADGKIVAAGRTTNNLGPMQIALARYNSDGSPDNSFSGDGKQITSISIVDQASSVAVQKDGKIVVAGSSDNGGVSSMAILRYSSDGSLDPMFSGDGIQTITVGWQSVALAMVIQNDGKVVLGGYSLNNYNAMKFIVARLNTDGSSDNSFSGDGIQISDFGGGDALIQAMALQNDDKIVVAGSVNFTGMPGTQDFAAVRYNTDGSLDNNFSGDGLAALNVTSGGTYPFASANSLGIQADGKFVLGGSCSYDGLYAAVRLNVDGSLDNSFDGDGILRDHKPAASSSYYASAVQADGKIVTAGVTGDSFREKFKVAVARYHNNGSLDSSFSGDGLLIIDLAIPSRARFDIAIQPDGKILVATSAFNGQATDFALLRLNPDGSLDNSFSGNGKVLTDLGGYNDRANSVAVQSDGKIVVGGYRDFANDNFQVDFAMVRYNADGALDNSFSGDGKLTTDFNLCSDKIEKILIQPDGKILAIGTTMPFPPINSDIAIARYNTDGSLDPSFDGDGKLTTDIMGEQDFVSTASLLPNGNIVVGGQAGHNYLLLYYNYFMLLRYKSNGSLDSSFADHGKLVSDLGPLSFSSLSFQPDGKIIGGGSVTNGYHTDMTLMRIKPDGTFDSSFSDDGQLVMDLGYGEDRINSLSIQGNRLYAAGTTAYGGQVGLLAAFLIGCPIDVVIPDAITLSSGVDANTVYRGYEPASDLTLKAEPSGGKPPYSYQWSNGATTRSIKVSPTVSTTYLVTVTDASGCNKTARKLVKVIDIRCGNKLDKVLVCPASPGKSCNTRTDCISANAVPAHLRNGGYLGNCKTSKPGDQTEIKLDVYPNPSNSKFTLVLLSNSQEMVSLTIWDGLGRVIERRRINPNQPVELGSSYRPGIYFAELTQGRYKIWAKLVKGSH